MQARKLPLPSRGANRAGWRSLTGTHQQGFNWARPGWTGQPEWVRQGQQRRLTAGWPWAGAGHRLGPPGGWVTASGPSSKLRGKDWLPGRVLFGQGQGTGRDNMAGGKGWELGIFSWATKTVKAEGTWDAIQKDHETDCSFNITGKYLFKIHYRINDFVNELET